MEKKEYLLALLGELEKMVFETIEIAKTNKDNLYIAVIQLKIYSKCFILR